jgi:hypothetical protein
MRQKFTPDITHVAVSDIRAYIKRQLTQRNEILASPPQGEQQALFEKTIPVKPRPTSLVNNALEVYDGSIDFDHWLNLAATTKSETNKVEKVLSGKSEKAFEYLQCIGLPAKEAICGHMVGKIRSMSAICTLRQLYDYRKKNVYKNWSEFYQEACRLNHFTQFTPLNPDFAEKLAKIIDASEDFFEVPTAIVSAYLPINNVVHAKRIFKNRVKKIVVNEFYDVLRHPREDTDYAIYYCLGFLSKLYFLDLTNPYWTEMTCYRPLNLMIRLYEKVIHSDYDFVSETFPIQISAFLSKHHFRIEPLYALYAFRLIYTSAVHHKSIQEAVEILSAFQLDTSIEFFVDSSKFCQVYKDLPYHDLSWANRQLETIVVVKFKA